MSQKFSVLIIEDDFRVANIHQQYVEKVDGFEVQETVNSGKDALHFLQNTKRLPDLILLDIYIPDIDGLDLFWQIRKSYHDVDIMVVTAAKEVETIQETLRGGIFDYIVKPFDDTRFKQTLQRYKAIREQLEWNDELNQDEIDYLFGAQGTSTPSQAPMKNLPKGIDSITLSEINSLLSENDIDGITATELSKQIGVSRSTARRYLEYLVSVNEIETKLIYGSVGRPERRYLLAERKG